MQTAVAQHAIKMRDKDPCTIYKVLMIHKVSYGVDHISLSNAKIRDSSS